MTRFHVSLCNISDIHLSGQIQANSCRSWAHFLTAGSPLSTPCTQITQESSENHTEKKKTHCLFVLFLKKKWGMGHIIQFTTCKIWHFYCQINVDCQASLCLFWTTWPTRNVLARLKKNKHHGMSPGAHPGPMPTSG